MVFHNLQSEQDSEILENLQLFLKDVLNLAETKISDYCNCPYLIKNPYYKLVDNELKIQYRSIDYDKLAKDIECHITENVDEHPSYSKTKEIMDNAIKKEINSRKNTEKASNLPSGETFLSDFILMYLNEYGTDHNIEGCEKFIKDFNTFLKNNMYYEYWLAPLYNFNNTSNSDLELSDELYIRKITSSEYSKIVHPYDDQIAYRDRWLRFVLIKKFQNDDWQHELNPKVTDLHNLYDKRSYPALEKFKYITNALSIFKPGDLFFGDIYSASDKTALSHPCFPEPRYPKYMIDNQYIIKDTEWSLFCELYKFIESVTEKFNTNYPKSAINRFGMAMENENHNERIVDFVIALESLIIPNSKCLRERFSSRLSTLLNNDFNDIDMVEFMKKVYDFRSKYVHESEPKEDKIKGMLIKEVAKKLETYARISFLRYLSLLKHEISNNGEKLKDIRDEIDESLKKAKCDPNELKNLEKCWGQFDKQACEGINT